MLVSQQKPFVEVSVWVPIRAENRFVIKLDCLVMLILFLVEESLIVEELSVLGFDL